jgi:hypothetical protein
VRASHPPDPRFDVALAFGGTFEIGTVNAKTTAKYVGCLKHKKKKNFCFFSFGGKQNRLFERNIFFSLYLYILRNKKEIEKEL